MDMISPDCSLDDIHFVRIANLPDDFATTQTNIVFQSLLTVFGNPDKVVETTVGRVRGMTILVCHVHILPCWKPRTKVRSFPLQIEKDQFPYVGNWSY